ncbi:MAG TPA: peptidoglycan-binding domain-containing protein [Polyangia bacterium]|nr:peptidoglycan-binding domain-containing protein [Polyangia bacterium]
MRLSHAVALGLLAGALGCGHTKTTDAASAGSEKAEERTPPADHPDRVPGASSGAKHENPTQTSAIPVPASPEGLLAPGAEDQIRDKLADGGYLDKGDKAGSLDAGLRKFQKAKDMPVTGIPDHRTIQALGLDPGRIFKHADVNK